MLQPFSPATSRYARIRERNQGRMVLPRLAGAALLFSLAVLPAKAAEIGNVPGSGTFGRFVSISESGLGLVSAWNQSPGGYTYLYKNLDTATGTVTERTVLLPSPATVSGGFGHSVSLSGNNALIGAMFGEENYVGSAYLYRNVGSATGTVTQDVTLLANDGPARNSLFGRSLQMSGNLAVVGAQLANGVPDMYGNVEGPGAAYVFRNLDTASGTVSPNLKLIASDRADLQRFGTAVSVDGTLAVVGANWANGVVPSAGAAYVYRNVDTANGTVTENAKLIVSHDRGIGSFGSAVSVSGDMALVGSHGDYEYSNYTAPGSAYLYRNLGTATGTITETAKLVASVPVHSSIFGYSVSLSGNVGLVGSNRDNQGAVYLFLNLDTATGTVNENIILTASNRSAQQFFGNSVDLTGDNIMIGTYSNAFTASLSSITKLDEGNATRQIDGISFVSKEHWTIGQSTDNNEVILSAGDTADVRAFGKAVYIGKNAGSDTNTLVVSGSLAANTVYIGSIAGNEDNTLQFDSTASFGAVTLRLADDNFLSIQGNYTDTTALLGYLGLSTLQVWDGDLANWISVTIENAPELVWASFSSGYTTIQAGAVPEPASGALVILGMGLVALRGRRSAR
jgi:hypothetical protein